jgi:hypothetical protein
MKKGADDWGWTRSKDEMFTPAIDFRGKISPEVNYSNTGPARANQAIFRQDRVQNVGDAAKEGYGSPSWDAILQLLGIVGTWSPEDYIEQVYNMPSGRDIGDNHLFDTYNLYQSDRPLAAGRKSQMKRIAEEDKTSQENVDLKELRKELGIVLNANGMPTVDFRDGSFIEIRAKLEDGRKRHQGVDDETKYMVILAYPSLGYENEVGRGGYKTSEEAENMLINYAKVHIAKGLTYSY